MHALVLHILCKQSIMQDRCFRREC